MASSVTMNRKAVTIITLLSMLMLSMTALYVTDGSSAVEPNVTISDMGSNPITVKAGSSTSFDIVFANLNAYNDESIVDDYIVTMSVKVVDSSGAAVAGVTTSISVKGTSLGVEDGYAIITGQDRAIFVISLTTDRYVVDGSYTLEYTYSVFNNSHVAIGTPVTTSKDLVIQPVSDSGGYYNKFLGIFPNQLEGALGQSWFAALVTFILIILIGVILAFVAAPAIAKAIAGNDSEDKVSLKGTLSHMIILSVTLFGIARTIAVYGIKGESYDVFYDLYLMIYVLIVAYLAWKIFSVVLDRIGNNMERHNATGALNNYNSFKPLFAYIGKIVITLAAAFLILSYFGVNMTAIITSAGLITLGITFGAQQILAQFFAGLLLLTTRPFKKGDIIQLGTSDVYVVRKVNVMNTELVNWDNSDVTIVPNNTLTGGKIKNLTMDTHHFKLYVFVGVGYNEDVDLARKLMLEAAMEHPHVVKNGPEPAPATSFIDYLDSNVQLRLNIWIDDFNLYVRVGSDLRAAMFDKFKANGVSIDWNQIVVHTATDTDNKN